MEKIYKFTDKEENARKRWLLSTLFLYLLPPVLAFLHSLIEQENDLIEHAIYIFGSSLAFFILYINAYKNNGTKWLMWSNFAFPISIINQYRDIEYTNERDIIWAFVLYAPLIIWWFITSCELRQINKKAQAEKENCREYLKFLHILKDSKTFEELENTYHQIIQRWPKFECASTSEYKKLKLKLLS